MLTADRRTGKRSASPPRAAGSRAVSSLRAVLCVLGLLLGVLGARVAIAKDEAAKAFPRDWQAAGQDETKKVEVLRRLAEDGGEEAARLLVGVAVSATEPPAVVEAAIHGLAGLEGKPGDVVVAREVVKASKWPDRAILVRAIARRASEGARALLIEALGDRQWQVKAAAIEGLRRHRVRETVEALLALWARLDPKADETPRLAGDIRDTLLLVTGKEFQTTADAQSWWSQSGETWAPDAKGGKTGVETSEPVTQERTPRLFEEIASRKVLFVVDTSASMKVPSGSGGRDAKHPNGLTRFEVLVSELRRVVEDLPEAAEFGLIHFGDKVFSWKDKLQKATPGNKKAARRFVDALAPDGQTNSHGALEKAFQVPEVDTIYFLSDGFPTVGKVDFNVIHAEVRRWNAARNVRIHTIAFLAGDGKPLGIVEGDKAMPKEFMKGLAQQNGGRYKLVE